MVRGLRDQEKETGGKSTGRPPGTVFYVRRVGGGPTVLGEDVYRDVIRQRIRPIFCPERKPPSRTRGVRRSDTCFKSLR